MLNVSQLVNVTTKYLTRNSTAVLTGLSITGLIVTTILAVKATPKALLLIEEAEEEKKRYLTVTENVKTVWKEYVPACIMAGVTIASIIGAHHIATRRHAALVGIYTITDKAFRDYKRKVVEVAGPKRERLVSDDIAKDKVIANPITENTVFVTGHGSTLCYDALSGRYFKSDMESIRQALNKLSRDLMSENTISLNQVYSELNLTQTKLGEVAGWHIDDGLIEPDFTSQLTDLGEPCLVLDFIEEPRYNLNWT